MAKKVLTLKTGGAFGAWDLGLATLAWMRSGKRFSLAEQRMEGDQF